MESHIVRKMENFGEFGLTDWGIAHVARGRYGVLSCDESPVAHLRKLGIVAITPPETRRLA